MSETLPLLRSAHPRLFHAVDDPDFTFGEPTDELHRRIRDRLLADAAQLAALQPWRRIPRRPHSPHPYHQLYITFYTAMQATALIEQFAFAWRLTRDRRWYERARAWLLAAASWEHNDTIEEHFYTANRYMQAFAVALDLLHEDLPEAEREAVTQCLVRMMQRWAPDVIAQRHSPAGGHHAVVDNGHFGVAALHLLGEHPDAPAWVDAVVDRFRAAILPHGCEADGAPLDGPGFWAAENLWMLQFVDALRNVTGLDLQREFPHRFARPLVWFRHQLLAPGTAMLAGDRGQWAAPLLRLSQDAGDAELRAAALADPALGGVFRGRGRAKHSTAEWMIAVGPYAYLYLDPHFTPRKQRRDRPSRQLTRSGYGDLAVLRESWAGDGLAATVLGWLGSAPHAFSELGLFYRGQPVLRSIPCRDGQPVLSGALPGVGGQNELICQIQDLHCGEAQDVLRTQSLRVDSEYRLLRGRTPLFLALFRRRPRLVQLTVRDGRRFAHCDGTDYLQYPREPWFSPDAGGVCLQFRLERPVAANECQVLWHVGSGIGGRCGTQVNNFTLGFLGDGRLTFQVQSQRGHTVSVGLPPEAPAIQPGRWYEAIASWGGFNDPAALPFIELTLDHHTQRCQDAARFGEAGCDSQGLAAHAEPRPFYIQANTVMAFGAAVQLPQTGLHGDLAALGLQCPGRPPFVTGSGAGWCHETGSGELTYQLHPTTLAEFDPRRVVLGAPGAQLTFIAVGGPKGWCREEIPWAPPGLAAGSLQSLDRTSRRPATRLRLATHGDWLAWVAAPAGVPVTVFALSDAFAVGTSDRGYEFHLGPHGWAQST